MSLDLCGAGIGPVWDQFILLRITFGSGDGEDFLPPIPVPFREGAVTESLGDILADGVSLVSIDTTFALLEINRIRG